MKIVAFAGSNSKKSINKSLATYASSLFEGANTNLLDLNDYEVTLYSIDKEEVDGIPLPIKQLASQLDEADLIIISLAEHNGTYSVAFKNVYDWLSRITDRKTFGNKPILLMATSPGSRGGIGVLSAAHERFPRDGSEILDVFSLPSFYENFNADKGITSTELRTELIKKVNTIKYKQFSSFYKDDSFTCGIDTTKDDAGDAIEY